MSKSDRELLSRAREGDHEAFGEIAERYQAKLRGYAARYLASSEDVFDVVQDAFLDAFSNLERFDLDRPFEPWIRTICRNRVYRFLRDRKSSVDGMVAQLDVKLLEMRDEKAADVPDEHLSALRDCVESLPDKNRTLLRLRYSRGLSIDEIAGHVERTDSAVAMALSRLRGALRRCIEQRLEHGDPAPRVEGGLA